MSRVRAALEPVDSKRAAALIAQSIEIFGVPKNWNRIADFYLEALEDIPPDLAEIAMKRVRQECRFFPKPAEIRAMVANDLARRKTAALRLGHALWRFGRNIG